MRQHLIQSLGFVRAVKQTWQACETLLYRTRFDILTTKNGFSGSKLGSGPTGVFKKFLQALPLSLPAGFRLLARFFRSSALTESLAKLTQKQHNFKPASS